VSPARAVAKLALVMAATAVLFSFVLQPLIVSSRIRAAQGKLERGSLTPAEIEQLFGCDTWGVNASRISAIPACQPDPEAEPQACHADP